ncbi:MAG TPA: hypothetical protein VLI39_16625 [Sedimentisphaerales bacterium]|nr:hypothetical protein [Sedimentisphaerales bacterium]
MKRQRPESRPNPIARHRTPRVPPPESEVWPEQYRGPRWKPIYAILFEGKCVLCSHSCPLPRSRQLEDNWRRLTPRLHCTHHPSHPGELREVLLTDTCRNFKPKRWRRSRTKRARAPRQPTVSKSVGETKPIPLGNGLFATVDAADYPELSKVRWYANRHGCTIYACRYHGGSELYMHRVIAQPRRDQIVHHRDHDGLNNCRDNFLVCTRRQHQACRGPLEDRRFVGVYRFNNRWQASIRYHGRRYYLGTFDDEIEAAKARDRKAYELAGEMAYLNFPEDLPMLRRSCRKKRTRGHKPAKRSRS